MTRQFLVFLAAGGVAAAANVGSRIIFSAALPLEVAVLLAYLVGMAVAFVLMRSHVFPPSGAPLKRQVARFALVNVLAVAQTFVVTLVLARWALPLLGMKSFVEEVAHVIGVCVPLVTSFVGHKRYSFR